MDRHEEQFQKQRFPIHWRICAFFVLICSAVTLSGGLVYYHSSKHAVVSALEERGAQLCEQACRAFIQQYAHPAQHMLDLIETSPQVNDYLMSPRGELLLRKSDVERLFVKVCQASPIYMSLRLLDLSGREKVVVVGNRRVRKYGTLETMARGGPVATRVSELFVALQGDESRPFACSDVFRDDTGRWTFLAGVAKLEPEIGGFGGAIVLQFHLDPYIKMVSELGSGNDPEAHTCLVTGEVITSDSVEGEGTESGPRLARPDVKNDIWTTSEERMVLAGQPVLKVEAHVTRSLVTRQVAPIVGSALAVFAPTLLASIVASLWASRWISKPIRKLTAAVAEVSSSHLCLDLPEEITESNNEIGDLAAAFTSMIGDLRDTTTSVEALNQEIAERQEAEAELRTAQQRLVETAHRAGMADVASEVLHNVGNILNSVNIGTTQMSEMVAASKVDTLAEVVAMLDERREDLGAFLSEDTRGKHIPVFLSEVSGLLQRERDRLAEMLDGLTKNVQHIKDTISTQQTYARVSAVEQPTSLEEVIEDAVQINQAGLDRHGARLVYELERLPGVQINKQKVVQVLVNLIKNGKYAVAHGDQEDKVMRIRLYRHGEDRFRIEVIDNGIGIGQDNLTKIFRHGFTTKRHGHGFGLHSGALAAKEMGGSLSVHSDGVGLGATFTLELPFKPVMRG